MKLINLISRPADILSAEINDKLKNNNSVVWLLPGGSNIPISVEAMAKIEDELTNRLVLLQTDERYVQPENHDCNWHQLLINGFDIKRSTCFPVILNEKETLDEVARRYSIVVNEQFEKADYIIGQFGLGSDGHVAGIKPGSIAVDSKDMVAGYKSEDFIRITMTIAAIRRIDCAITFAFGDNKRHVFEDLMQNNDALNYMPARVLNEISASFLYNDQIGEKL